MRHFFEAAGFKTAANLRAQALNLETKISKTRAPILAACVFAALSALTASASEAHKTSANLKAPGGEICLIKTSYKGEGGAVPRYEYEVSQRYDAASRILEKIYDKTGEDGRDRSKTAAKFDASGEREVASAEYEWDFSADKWRKVGLSKLERGEDGALVWTDLYDRNGKLNGGQKTVEKRTGKTEISQNFTLKNGKWTPTHLTKTLYDENNRNTLIATFEWNAKAKKWMPYEKSIFHYKGDDFAGAEGYAWRGGWVPQTRNSVFTAADRTRTEINFAYKDGAWQREEMAVRKIEPEHRRFTELRYRWDAAKSEWKDYFKNVREETEEGRLKRDVSSLWREESQRWEIAFESEFSYDARGNVLKNRQASDGKQYEYIYDYDEAGNNVSMVLCEPDENGKWHETQKTINVFEPRISAADVLDKGFIGDYIAAGENAIKSSKQYFLKDGEFKLNETREWFYSKCE